MPTIEWRKHKRKSGSVTKTAYLNWSDPETGKQCRVSLGKVSDSEAEGFRLGKEYELQTGAAVLSYAPLFSAMAEDYLHWRKSEYPDSQFRVKQIVEDHLLPAFQYFSLDSLNPRQVEKYKANRLKHVSEASVAKEVQTLKAMLTKAVEWQLIKFSPIQTVSPPRIRTSRPIHWYSMEDLQTLYGQSPVSHKLIWQLMANTGMRRGEAQNLKIEHDCGESIIIESTAEARTKSRKWREVPLSVNGREALDALLKVTRTNYVLPIMIPNSLTRAFKRDKGDLDGSLHSLRHTFGSHLAVKGTPVRVLQELMGHSSIKTTEKYLHVAQDHLSKAINGFSI